MNDEIVKRQPGAATKFRRETQQARDTLAAIQRLHDQYWARVKRAEADLYDGVKLIADALHVNNGDVTDIGISETSEQPTAQ